MSNQIKSFATQAAYDAAKAELIAPSVSLIENTGKVILSGMPQGAEYIDLGLPSGTLWATCNLGALSPEEGGMYFSWGNIDGHYGADGIYWGLDYYNTTPGHNLNGNITQNPIYDAAGAIKGTSWCMPTKEQFQELYDNCIWKWTKYNKKNGCLVTSKANGKSIFLPAAGNCVGTKVYGVGADGTYWSSSFNNVNSAYSFGLSSGGVSPQNIVNRYYGFTVRPVQNLS